MGVSGTAVPAAPQAACFFHCPPNPKANAHPRLPTTTLGYKQSPPQPGDGPLCHSAVTG